jgi:hypothetical protein
MTSDTLVAFNMVIHNKSACEGLSAKRTNICRLVFLGMRRVEAFC